MNFFLICLSTAATLFISNVSYSQQNNQEFSSSKGARLIKKETNYFTENKIKALNADQSSQSNGKLNVILELSTLPISTLPIVKTYRQSKSSSLSPKATNVHIKALRTKIKTEQTNVLKEIKSKGITHTIRRQFSYLYNGVSLEVDKSQLQSLNKIKGVKKVHIVQDKVLHLHDSIPLIKADMVWNLSDKQLINLTGKGVKVAILDSGIDYTRAELGGCFGEGCRVVDGYDFINDDADPMDDEGHGTHVAGIVGASGDIKGVAPDVTLYAYKVCDYFCPTDGIIAALEKAVDPDGDPLTDDGVDIINMSLGGPGELDDPLTVAVNELASGNILVVISAGNEGSSSATIASPGNAEKALTVAATDKYDQIASYSSRGPVLSEAFQKPEISAPGSDIESLAIGQGLVSFSGTSMAAPHVAGAAALIKQRYPQLTGQEIKSLLVTNTDPINYSFTIAGSGRLNALKAVEANILLNKNYLLFDRIDRTQEIWSAQQSVEIKNISNESITVNLSVDNNVSGISYAFGDVSEIVLASGASKLINVSVEITTANLVNATDLIHRSNLTITGGSHESDVPLLIFDAMRLQWQSEKYPLSIWINSLEGRGSSLRAYVNQGGLFVNTGEYVISAVFDEPEKVSWVVKTISVDDADINVDLVENDATNEIKVATFSDHLGRSRELASLYGSAIYLELAHPESLYRHSQWFNGWTNDGKNGIFVTKPVFVSSFSDEFELNYSFMYGDTQSPSDDYHIYTYTGSHVGVANNIDIALDGQLLSKIIFDVTTPDIFGGEYLWYLYSNLDAGNYHTSGWYTSGSGFSGPRDMQSSDNIDFLANQFTVTIHGNNQPNKRLGIYEFSLDQKGNWSNHINIQPVSFDNNTNSFIPAESEDDNRTYKISAEGLFVEAGISNYNNNVWATTYLRSDFYSQYSSDLIDSITIDCDGMLKYRETKEFYGMSYSKESLSNCEQSNFTVFYPNYLFGVKHQSITWLSIPVSGATSSFDKFDLRVLLQHNKNPEQAYTAKAQLFTDYTSLDNVEVKAFINYQGDWESIGVNLTPAENGITDVELVFPVLSAPYVTSLKLTYKANQNEGMTLISNAFLLGGTKADIMEIDRDNDGIMDGIDDDKDNDGIPDGVELINGLKPFDPSDALKDVDGDGMSNLDEYLAGRFISLIDGEDSDNDGVIDFLDAFPNDPTESVDSDNDGLGNNADLDDDNDGVDDIHDAFPLDESEAIDTDFDGIGNNADTDDDNDGVLDTEDAFLLDPFESQDTDNDGIGNNADFDDDNDGIEDNNDAFPLDPEESLDTDGDGVGNNADSDDDGDGVSDSNDVYPLDSSRSSYVTASNSTNTSSSSGGSIGYLILVLGLIFLRKIYFKVNDN